MLTGESDPMPKQSGDAAIAGTVNGASALCIRVTRLPNANTISDIRTLVSNALGAKPRVQDLADKVASWFIPTVVAISTVTFAIWVAVAITVRHESGGDGVGTAITYGIAVLAISCPCALGLAVPMVGPSSHAQLRNIWVSNVHLPRSWWWLVAWPLALGL